MRVKKGKGMDWTGGMQEKCRKAGMGDYLTKPIDFELMLKLIEGVFGT